MKELERNLVALLVEQRRGSLQSFALFPVRKLVGRVLPLEWHVKFSVSV